ncbi:hypothetical protein [Brachybacterium saurashtrense]|uniref:Uncharacterized protein n=1 Tax=Brachybacterium saurashtrense TaxID=556288 RepID=A0A345YPX4_9MICO|nr:hypothetical protein [Brachybacterium saurashtrense]AXK45976.1 hypothetical protein DWV08_10405 [Brachybacterium saurashtrense]RRR23715.1 hypothetical protein DXU92_02155 [Brachybacterium saurashtrense]
MTTPVSPSAVPPARTGHRLQLPRRTDPADVLAMVRNVRPEATEDADGVLHLEHEVRLVPDRSPRGAGRWTLETPREREDPQPEGMDDSHGYGRAFPDGVPFGVERRALDLAWSLGRRLHGAVVTDGGQRLEPHPFHERDLVVTSPHALAPESLAELLAPLEPEAELDQVPEEAPRAGYSVTIPLPDGDEISLRVGRSARPVALGAVGWLASAVDYELVHLPADPESEATELPEPALAARWQQAYQRIGRLAGLLVESVGGYVVDREGFLVDPADLA